MMGAWEQEQGIPQLATQTRASFSQDVKSHTRASLYGQGNIGSIFLLSHLLTPTYSPYPLIGGGK
jgi:hypothetical protein